VKRYANVGKLGRKSGEGFYSDDKRRCTLLQTTGVTPYRMGDASP
jgi:hypothetical protein